MKAVRLDRAPLLRGSTALAALSLLGGCATFGSNVKGSFSCAAPDGICAPSASIDDRALAMIAEQGAVGDPSPASGPTRSLSSKPSRTASSSHVIPVSPLDARRTQERVLRIIFQPYIDERGRLHEASAIHAVVQSGEWQQQVLADATSIPDRNAIAAGPQPESLADAVDRADLATIQAGGMDPNLPDPAVVAAARARRIDPVKAIQTDVAARLAPKAGRTPTPIPREIGKRQAETRSVDGAAQAIPASKLKVDGSSTPPVSAAAAAPVPAPKTTVGAEALSRIKASPAFHERAAQAESDARAAGQTGGVPATNVKAQPTIGAAGFPAVVPEDK